LEVSSPGLDRPISRDCDFEKFKGAKLKIKTHVKIDGTKNFQGTLLDYIGEGGRKIACIDVGGKIINIPKNEIAKANLLDEMAMESE
jgi:ribosome maturation factor RimP